LQQFLRRSFLNKARFWVNFQWAAPVNPVRLSDREEALSFVEGVHSASKGVQEGEDDVKVDRVVDMWPRKRNLRSL